MGLAPHFAAHPRVGPACPAHAYAPAPRPRALPALARPRAKLRGRVAATRRRRRIGVTRWPPQSRSPRHNPVPRSPFPPPLHFLLTPFQFGKAEWELTPSLHPPASSSVTAPPFFYSICLQLRLDLRHPMRPLLPSFSL
jgi:hypothetical protein